MTAMDKTQEIRRLHEKLYEQSLLFLALRTSPNGEATRAETRELIEWIYNRIQNLL